MKKFLVSTLSMLVGGGIGAGVINTRSNNKVKRVQEKADKHLEIFLMMNNWVKVKQGGRDLATYFKEHGYKKIAIYGMSYAGETLISELIDSEIEIAYGIDQKEGIYSYIDVFSVNHVLPEVDAIVVTAITFFDEIKRKLEDKVTCPIISLADIISEV